MKYQKKPAQAVEDPAPPAPGARLWRNRIVGHAEVNPQELKPNPKNWRLHPAAQREALAGVLAEVGWVQDVIVNQRTGFVIDGHARIDMAIVTGEMVPVVYVDLSAKEEALVLASLDPLTSMAMADEAALAPLIAQVESESTALTALLNSMLDQATVTQIRDAETAAAGESDAESTGRLSQEREQAVKAVFMVDELRTVERAIRAVGEPARGRALVAICEAYLESHASEQEAG
jgi:hypothetical protein